MYKSLLLAFGVAWSAVALSADFNREGLIKVSDDDGITVYVRDSESSVIEVIGETEINAPFERVMSVVTDSQRANEWMPRVREIVRLDEIDEWTRVQYSVVASPWPVSDRVFVSKGGVSVGPKGNSGIVSFQYVDGYKPDLTGRVEGRMHKSFFYMERSSKDPNKTFMRVNVVADPGGWLPTFVVNFFQKRWPIGFFGGLNSQLVKEDVKTRESIINLIKSKQTKQRIAH